MAWILVTWFVAASIPEHYGYKGFPNEAACISETRRIMKEITETVTETSNVMMTCVPTNGRDPDQLAKHVATILKASRKSK
jgi:hypothetical protein